MEGARETILTGGAANAVLQSIIELNMMSRQHLIILKTIFSRFYQPT
jgi:hypothetical protein